MKTDTPQAIPPPDGFGPDSSWSHGWTRDDFVYWLNDQIEKLWYTDGYISPDDLDDALKFLDLRIEEWRAVAKANIVRSEES